MAKQQKITDEMELAEAVAISRTFSLETLLSNFDSKDESVVLWRSAEEVLAECPDPQTMPRMLELLNQGLQSGWSAWFRPIKLRLRNKTIPPKERELAIAALLPLTEQKVDERELAPIAALALAALAAAHPLPREVVERCSKKLSHPHYGVASCALRVLIHLPPDERARWVPLLLKQLQGRFSKDSEATWIIECLPLHFASHRTEMVPVLRTCLKSEDTFVPKFVLELLCRAGSAASEFVPDILEFIGRQKAFSNEEPYLIHIDPEGTSAIPGLIKLLSNQSSYVNYQAATELEAYGTRAQPAIEALTKLSYTTGKESRFAAMAAQRALLAINSEGGVPERLSQTERLFGVMEDIITDSSDKKVD